MSECRLGRLAWRSRTPSMRDAQTLPAGPSRPISVVRRPRGTRAHDCTEQCEEIGAAGIFVRWGVLVEDERNTGVCSCRGTCAARCGVIEPQWTTLS